MSAIGNAKQAEGIAQEQQQREDNGFQDRGFHKRDIKNRLASKMVTVIVGSEEEEFTAHEQLLVSNADFFKAAMSGGWAESKTGRIYLSDTTPVMFDMFYTWLYLDSVDVEYSEGNPELFVRCWLLGEYLQSDGFKNMSMRCLVLSIDMPSIEVVNLAYMNTLEGAKLRTVLIDLWISFFQPRLSPDPGLDVFWHPDFASGVVVELVRQRDDLVRKSKMKQHAPNFADLSLVGFCKKYHDHKDTAVIYCWRCEKPDKVMSSQ